MPDEPAVIETPIPAPAEPAEPNGEGKITVDQIREALAGLSDEDRPYSNRDEVVAHNKMVRELKKEFAELKELVAKSSVKPDAKSKKDDPLADLESRITEKFGGLIDRLTRDKSLTDAMLSTGIPVPEGKKKIIEKLYAADMPEDVGAWITQTFKELGIKKEDKLETPKMAPEQKPLLVETTPASRSSNPHQLPENPSELDVNTLASMTTKERKKYIGDWLRKGNTNNWMRSEANRRK